MEFQENLTGRRVVATVPIVGAFNTHIAEGTLLDVLEDPGDLMIRVLADRKTCGPFEVDRNNVRVIEGGGACVA